MRSRSAGSRSARQEDVGLGGEPPVEGGLLDGATPVRHLGLERDDSSNSERLPKRSGSPSAPTLRHESKNLQLLECSPPNSVVVKELRKTLLGLWAQGCEDVDQPKIVTREPRTRSVPPHGGWLVPKYDYEVGESGQKPWLLEDRDPTAPWRVQRPVKKELLHELGLWPATGTPRAHARSLVPHDKAEAVHSPIGPTAWHLRHPSRFLCTSSRVQSAPVSRRGHRRRVRRLALVCLGGPVLHPISVGHSTSATWPFYRCCMSKKSRSFATVGLASQFSSGPRARRGATLSSNRSPASSARTRVDGNRPRVANTHV